MVFPAFPGAEGFGSVTIAGQTTPGGIATAGNFMAILTNDVIMRHMRIRTGSNAIVYERSKAGDPDGEGEIVCYDNMYQNCNQGNKVPRATPGVPHVLRKMDNAIIETM